MNFKIKYFWCIYFLLFVYDTYECPIKQVRFVLLEDDLYQGDKSLFSLQSDSPAHKYYDPIANMTLECEPNCYKCTYLKKENDSQCVACDENYYLYKYRCVDKCPINTYFYSYQKKLSVSGIEENRVISICDEECEKGYTGYITYDKSINMTKNECIINENNEIKEQIEIRLNDFLKINNTNEKLNKIDEQKETINKITEINTNSDFKNINIEFILYNKYIYNIKELIKDKNLTYDFNQICLYYFKITDEYFTSLGGINETLSNPDNIFISFISVLSSLLTNNNLLEDNSSKKFKNYTYYFNENLINFPIIDSNIELANIILNYYTTYLNETLNEEKNNIDPNFDRKEFDKNELYRYSHEILKDEEHIRLMNITNNLIIFLNNIDTDTFLYKNDFISFYKQKILKDGNDTQIIMSKLGLELFILGTETNNKTNSFSISSILDSIDEGKIDNFKIILPSLNTINSQVNWDEAFFNIVIFNEKYPLLNINNTKNVSNNFFEINLYDKNKNTIKVSDLNEDNLIKIIKKKSENEHLLDTCVYYDLSQKNLYDKGIKSYDLLQYILCSTSHLSTFTLTSFSPSYLLSKAENNKEISEDEMIKYSWWIKDTNMLNKLTSENAIIIYINIGIIFFCIILSLIKFLSKTEPTKAEQIIEDSYIRYTINEDTESDKKILKYIIEKEIEFILKNRSDYEKQKRQELALNSKNDIFNSDQQVITIIEDGSDDDDEEDINIDKRYKKVSFVDFQSEKKIKNPLTKIKRNTTLKNSKKSKSSKKEINIELPKVKEENIDLNDLDDKEETIQTKKYKFFNFKNQRKSNFTPSLASSNRHSTYANFDNIINQKKTQNKKKVKNITMGERFNKRVKEQKSRLIYSIMDKTLTEFKNNGQNTLDIPTSMIKRPLSMIGISNALNKINNKDDEKILIKNEFFVIMKLILYILYQYEYRFISLYKGTIILPITRENLIALIGFRLSFQLTLSSFFSPRYFGDNYRFAANLLGMIVTLIIGDIVYTIIEIILMKKKISTSTENKDKRIIKFKQIIECIIGYIIMIFILLFGLYHSILISLYLDEKNIRCKYIVNFISVFFIDYLIYENIIIIIKGFILTYAVYQDVEGCKLKFLEIFDKIFIFYLAE